jgi:hypothetical protein
MIYFLQAEIIGRIKIGYSSRGRLKSRIDQLRTASPVNLTLLACIEGDRAMERHLHERFAAARVCGEWFHPSATLVRFIAEIGGCAELSLFLTPPPSGTIQSRILGHLRTLPAGEGIRAPDLAAAIGTRCDKVRVVLHRLLRRGRVARFSKTWMLPVKSSPNDGDDFDSLY